MEQKTEEKKYNVYKRKLRIDSGCGLGRKFEKINEFGESYFRDNYYDAFAVTQKIIERNKKIKEKRNGERETCKREFGQERLYNIVTFCGDRGAGKTSVMDSVVGALQSKSTDYKDFIAEYEKEEGRDSDLSRMLDNYRFVCLEGIDASLLEGKEDILDVILSKMLQRLQQHIKSRERDYFENEMRVCCQTDIIRKFEEIYQNRRNLLWRMENPYEPGESSAEHLSTLAGSLDIREKLQKLIPIYLQALQVGGEIDKQYLVINIDDLDMHGKAYQMLEQLHRYLMIPQVIIYIAVSEKEIGAVCEGYFRKIYDRPRELAMSYLEKVLPFSQRIYLPDAFSGDFFNIMAGVADPKLDIYLVKDYLLKKIAEKTWVFYDGKGLETHFYEIGNLRALYNFYYLLEGMKNTRNDSSLFREGEISEEQRGILDGNFEKLKNDVIGRMAAEKLSTVEQRRIFEDYYREDFSTNGEYLLEQIINITDDKDFSKECSDYGYSYGTLLYALYNLSKVRQDFKPLVQCVLAMATIELTQNYIYAFHTNERITKIKWREYLSGSICGNWGNRMLPAVKYENNSDQCKPVAYVKDQTVCIEAAIDIQQNGGDVFSELIEKYALVQSFELLMAFITKKNVIKKEKDISMERGNTGIFKIKSSEWECTFDVLGPIVNVVDYGERDGIDDKKYFKRVRDMLLGMLKKCADDSKGTPFEPQWEELEKKMKAASLERAYEEWKQNYGRTALPLYSMDIMYNVLKRVEKRMNRELPQQIEAEEFLTAAKQFYRTLGEELREENKFYNGEEEETEQNRTCFYEGFCYYPFIYPFIELENYEDSEKEPKVIKTLKQKFPNKLPKLFEDLFTKLVQELVSCSGEGKSK